MKRFRSLLWLLFVSIASAAAEPTLPSSAIELPAMGRSACYQVGRCVICSEIQGNGRMVSRQETFCQGPSSPVTSRTPEAWTSREWAPLSSGEGGRSIAPSSWLNTPHGSLALSTILLTAQEWTRPDAYSKEVAASLSRYAASERLRAEQLHARARELRESWRIRKTESDGASPEHIEKLAQSLRQAWNAHSASTPPAPPIKSPEADFVRGLLREAGRSTSAANYSEPTVQERIELERQRSSRQGAPLERYDAALAAARKAAQFNSGSSKEFADGLLHEARQLRRDGHSGTSTRSPLLNRVRLYESQQQEFQVRRARVEAELPALPLTDRQRQRAETGLRLSGALAQQSEAEFWSGKLEVGESLLGIAKSVLDVGLGVTPVVGAAKDFQELVTGQNLVTGEALTSTERAFAALGVVTLGVGSEVKGVARALEKVGQALAPAAEIALKEARVLLRSPKVQQVLGRLSATPELATRITTHLQKYLVAAEHSTQEMDVASMNRIADRFIDLERRFEGVPVKSDLGRVPLLRGRLMSGDVSKMSDADKTAATFRWGVDGIVEAEHRFSIGGKFGQDALYAVIDDGLPARQTILAELRVMEDKDILALGKALELPPNLVLGRIEVKLDRVLDLTDESVIRHLNLEGISLVAKKEEFGLAAYEVTQQIGFLSRQNGFDAVIAKSAQFRGHYTFTLFRGM